MIDKSNCFRMLKDENPDTSSDFARLLKAGDSPSRSPELAGSAERSPANASSSSSSSSSSNSSGIGDEVVLKSKLNTLRMIITEELYTLAGAGPADGPSARATLMEQLVFVNRLADVIQGRDVDPDGGHDDGRSLRDRRGRPSAPTTRRGSRSGRRERLDLGGRMEAIRRILRRELRKLHRRAGEWKELRDRGGTRGTEEEEEEKSVVQEELGFVRRMVDVFRDKEEEEEEEEAAAAAATANALSDRAAGDDKVASELKRMKQKWTSVKRILLEELHLGSFSIHSANSQK